MGLAFRLSLWEVAQMYSLDIWSQCSHGTRRGIYPASRQANILLQYPPALYCDASELGTGAQRRQLTVRKAEVVPELHRDANARFSLAVIWHQ
jgi:hypothetical protein